MLPFAARLPAPADDPQQPAAAFSASDRSIPWNLTFAHTAEKVSDGDSSRLQVVSIDRERIPAERLHPKAAYSHCRPNRT